MANSNHLPNLVFLLKACLFFFPIISILRNAAADTTGFISIDCGATEEYNDNESGILYKSDRDFIETGVRMPISSEISTNRSQQLKNVRSFPQGTRNCYVLKPEKGKNNNYLIRASFFYGNYDGKNQAPVFDLYLGANMWWTVDWDDGYAEILHIPSTDYVNVCLLNTGNGVPYISSLELRNVEYSIDQNRSNALVTMQRYDVGGVSNVRYPNDDYDRIWNPLNTDTLNSSFTNSNISRESNDSYKIPNVLLRTAIQEYNFSCSLGYIWTAPQFNSQYYFYFHFAEIENLEASKRRELRIDLNGESNASMPVTLEYLKPLSISLKGQPDSRGQFRFIISSVAGSDLPPLLNGFEIYAMKEMQNSIAPDDVDAIMGVKQMYRVLRNWEGDPCIPTELLWQGVNCNNISPPRIISLNLSSSILTGDIPASISNLREIISLDLSYNKLTGRLPEFLAQLPNLRVLNLTANKLTGSVPSTLLRKSKDGSLIMSVSGNPDLCTSYDCGKNRKKFLIPTIVSSLVALVLAIIACAVVLYKRRKREITKSNQEGPLKSNNQQLTYSEIVVITSKFKTIIGEGGFGKVYLGTLKDKSKVAIKILSPSSRQGYNEFRAEARILMIVHHKHLVSLIGYCDEGEKKALVYEYMANGNLRQHLSAEANASVLSWTERLRIAVDAAQGLDYLHNGCKPAIIHRDMKTTNILLNERMQAKIADFGLSRAFASESDSHLSTCPAGTFGYLDPEIHSSGNFSRKSDVYSFGIVLLELVTGRPAIIRGVEYNIHIIEWVKPLISEGDIQNIVDPRLQGNIESNSAWKAVELAVSCTLPTAKQRPDMGHVLSELVECLEMVQGKAPAMPTESYEKASCNSIGSESVLSPR